MALTPITFERFGGLDLLNDPEELGATGAVDLLNVDLDRLGRVRTRDGFVSFATGTLSGTINNLVPSPAGGGRIYAVYYNGGNYYFEGFDSSGASVALRAASASATATTPSYAHIGSSATSRTYFTIWDASANYTCQKINPGGVSNGTGKPAFVAVSPVSNRLIEANFDLAASSPTGANGDRSTVFWSDAGDPQTFSANNWVTLRPNDGEEIVGVVTWRDMTFIAKQSSVFIFQGEGIDASGNPTFPYRRVDLPAPMWRSTGLNRSPMVAGGEYGVFLSTPNGIYRTAGDTPTLISAKVQELFGTASNYSTLQFDGNPPILAWANGRLLATYKLATGGATRTLAWDPRTDQWTLWANLGTTGVFVTFAPGAYATSPATADFQERMLFPSSNVVYYTDPDATTDNGSSIQWSYRSGKYPVADPGRVAVIQESSLTGYSTTSFVILDVGSDSLGFPGGGSVVVGTGTTPAEGYLMQDNEGKLFQHNISGTVPATISRLTHWVSFVKPSGVQ